ncbi:MAG: hypothetical protein IJC86_01090 [Clostridia bacterium]|nr:hypothetical protein [Clostridia bacterium]
MAYIIFSAIMVIFSVIGFVGCIKSLIFRVYRGSNDKTIMLISPAKGHCEDIEYTLRSCGAKVRWMGKVRPDRIICLDNGMDISTRQVAELVCCEYEFMEILKPEELTEVLSMHQ